MPSIEIKHEYEFEAYCAECRSGICDNIETNMRTPGRLHPFIRITPCAGCLEDARDKKEREMQKEIDRLEREIERMKGEQNQ
jgi:hypothetical protein